MTNAEVAKACGIAPSQVTYYTQRGWSLEMIMASKGRGRAGSGKRRGKGSDGYKASQAQAAAAVTEIEEDDPIEAAIRAAIPPPKVFIKKSAQTNNPPVAETQERQPADEQASAPKASKAIRPARDVAKGKRGSRGPIVDSSADDRGDLMRRRVAAKASLAAAGVPLDAIADAADEEAETSGADAFLSNKWARKSRVVTGDDKIARLDGESLIEASLRKEVALADKNEIENARQRGELAPVQALNAFFAGNVIKAREIVMGIRLLVPNVRRSPTDIDGEELVEKECRRALFELEKVYVLEAIKNKK